MPLFDERQRRVLSGACARMLGRGGVSAVARTAAMSRNTVIAGSREITTGVFEASPRVRKEGGGRKRLIDKDPNLLLELDDLVSPEARGDPMSPLRWTAKSTYHLANALSARVSRSAPAPWATCSPRWAIASRAPPNRERAPSTWTETPSSTTSTTRRGPSW